MADVEVRVTPLPSDAVRTREENATVIRSSYVASTTRIGQVSVLVAAWEDGTVMIDVHDWARRASRTTILEWRLYGPDR